MHIKRILEVAALVAGMLAPRVMQAQFALGATYIEIGGGVAFQPDTIGAHDVRDRTGVAGTLAVGRYASPHLAYEGRLAFEHFGLTQELLPPCPVGLPDCGIRSHEVKDLTLGVDAQLSTNHAAAAPLLIVGAGVRRIQQLEQVAGPQVAPYAELGGGINVPLGGVALALEGRIQLSSVRDDLPRWTAPITLGLRF